jgi:hypothetical protein
MPAGIEHDDGVVFEAFHQQAEAVFTAQHGSRGWGRFVHFFFHRSPSCIVRRHAWVRDFWRVLIGSVGFKQRSGQGLE